MDGDVPDDERQDVERAAAGDIDAFERIYRRHAARVHSLVRRMIGPRHAEDATQEIFLRAWKKLRTFRGEGSFGGWLSRLASRHALTRISRARPEGPGEPVDSRLLDEMRGEARHPERAFDLEAAVAALPERARHVLVLHDVEGYGHAEIAGLLGVSVGTSKSQLHRARSLIREAMDAGSGPGGAGGTGGEGAPG